MSSVVAPNLSHSLFFLDFLESYPSAKGYVAPGVDTKNRDLMDFPVIGPSAWKSDLDGVFVEGLPVINETFWLHKATGTLILTDLLFCFERNKDLFTKLVACLLGVYGKMSMSRTMKLMIKDNRMFRESINKLQELDIKKIILSHDQIIHENANQKFNEAFSWLNEI